MQFRVFPRTQRKRAALEPVVAAEGGPGYPSIGSADSYLFIDDLAVSGRVVWDRRASRVTARLTLAGPVSGRLRLRWPLDEARAVVSIRGTLQGRGVRLRTPAP